MRLKGSYSLGDTITAMGCPGGGAGGHQEAGSDATSFLETEPGDLLTDWIQSRRKEKGMRSSEAFSGPT